MRVADLDRRSSRDAARKENAVVGGAVAWTVLRQERLLNEGASAIRELHRHIPRILRIGPIVRRHVLDRDNGVVERMAGVVHPHFGFCVEHG